MACFNYNYAKLIRDHKGSYEMKLYMTNENIDRVNRPLSSATAFNKKLIHHTNWKNSMIPSLTFHIPNK